MQNRHDMNLRRLRYFSVLAECLHFGKAAEMLSITQPPLSRQIKELEDELGVALFNRNKRNVALTPQGRYLYIEIQKILGQMQRLQRSVQKFDDRISGPISIGYVGAAMHCILPDLLSRLCRAYPEVNTVLEEISPERQVKAIRDGELDVGFVRAPLELNDVQVKTVYEEKFALVLPKHSEFDGDVRKKLRELADEPFISFAHRCGPALLASIVSICNRCDFSPRIVHQAGQLNTIIRMVESGLGYSIVPSSVQQGYDLDVQFIELDTFAERAYLSMIFAKTKLKPVVKRFVELVDESTPRSVSAR